MEKILRNVYFVNSDNSYIWVEDLRHKMENLLKEGFRVKEFSVTPLETTDSSHCYCVTTEIYILSNEIDKQVQELKKQL